MNRQWALSGVVLVLGACERPVAIDGYCRELTKTQCEVDQQNCGLSAAIDCSTLEPHFDCLNPYRAELRSGDRTYDPAAAGRCLEETRAAKGCSPLRWNELESCRAVVPGNGGEGAPCGTCKAGLFCSGEAFGSCGTCFRSERTVPSKIGERCSRGLGARSCQPDLWCAATSDGNGACEPLPALGESCESWCREGLFCRAGTCAQLPALGEPCETVCGDHLVCLEGVCAQRTTVGGACETGATCEIGLLCALGACAVPRQPGAACDDSSQCSASFCSNGTCKVGGSDGDPCSPQMTCGIGFECRDGTCAKWPTQGAACQQSCSDGFVCIDMVCAVKQRSTCR